MKKRTICFLLICIITFSVIISKTEAVSNASEELDNIYLQTMRLDVPGITPEFNKDITKYYLTVDTSVRDLDVIAIPENHEYSVNITGNKGLREGLNKIVINVTSKDGSKKKTYEIEVTRTSDIEKANTNLETLAVEFFNLEPDFSSNILEYRVDVPNDIEKINIYAVPESNLAKVEIQNIDKLKYGNNTIKVIVTAENKITKKEYMINVYKQTLEEDKEDVKKEEENKNQLTKIIDEAKAERASTEIEVKKSGTKILPVIVLATILAIIVISLIIIKKRNHMNK